MEYQNLFKSSYVESLRRGVEDGSLIKYYSSDVFEYDKEKVFFSPNIVTPGRFELMPPSSSTIYDCDNAKILYQAYKGLTPLEASDTRLWTYLSHADQYGYMSQRWGKIKDATAKNPSQYILDHWFLSTPSQGNLIRHGLAGLWWSAYLSYDENRPNPFELTDVLYTQLDLATRTLGTYKLARYKPAVLGILEFIKNNPNLFKDRFEAKQRFVTKHLNQLGGVKPLAFFGKEFFTSVLDQARYRIAEA